MCTILIKRAGIDWPQTKTIELCDSINGDGIGVCWHEKDKVIIQKGIRIQELDQICKTFSPGIPSILHFRHATSGTINKSSCHPFPVTDNIDLLCQTSVECDVAVAHNGHILIEKEFGFLTDTQEFIRKILSRYKDIFYNAETQHKVEQWLSYDRLCFLNNAGQILLMGAFVKMRSGIIISSPIWGGYKIVKEVDKTLFGMYRLYEEIERKAK